jgi:hypothetical protein
MSHRRPTRPPRPSGNVIDLGSVATPVRAVIELYDRHHAGATIDPGELAAALQTLAAAPVLPGRLGDDIAILLDPATASAGELAKAVERLRRLASYPDVAESRPRRRRSGSTRIAGQLALPGVDAPPEATA